MSDDWHLLGALRTSETVVEAADKLGVVHGTVRNRAERRGIDPSAELDLPWRDRLKMIGALTDTDSVSAAAEALDADPPTLSRWADKHGIDLEQYKDKSRGRISVPEDRIREAALDPSRTLEEHAEDMDISRQTLSRRIGESEYERVRANYPYPRSRPNESTEKIVEYTPGGVTNEVSHPRLLAVAEYGFDAVVDGRVTTWNGIGWDVRPENVVVMTAEDQGWFHSTGVPPERFENIPPETERRPWRPQRAYAGGGEP